MIIAGDFNAKSPRWGPGGEDRKGIQLCEWLQEMDMEVANNGENLTFERTNQRSWIDVTIHNMNSRVVNWRVTDDENLRNHKSIRYEVVLYKPGNTENARMAGELATIRT